MAATGLLVLVAAGCGETPARPESADGGGWTRVAEAPLSPREAPLAVIVGERILVIGGSDGPPCPPNADCVAPPEPLRDGAAYDPAADAWTPIADAPGPVGGGVDTAAVVGDTVYVLTTILTQDGTTTRTFQAYDAAADGWAELTPPPGSDWVSLTVAGDRVVAYRGSHEDDTGGSLEPLDPLPADLVYDPASDAWSALPADPLGPSFDRRLIGTDDGAVLLAGDLVPNPGVDPPVVRAARFDLAAGTWTELPDGDVVSGYGFRRVGDLLVSALEESADGGEVNNWGRDIPYGGILDPTTGAWSELPERAHRDPLDGFMIPVGDLTGERTIVSGACALDVPTLTWTRVPDLPVDDHVQGQSAAFADTADGRLVFLWGGSRWPGWPDDPEAMPEGELLAEGWVWTVPLPRPSG
ncbi:Kelch repeat-containing protein [Jiangella rhizosphaerae]|uniref:Kelch repeat-containing protein n=1 Tax=Jiangella rhizosphaerae TaxID=2293569 RepID=UPI00131490CA|nr:hypothetical protein [Jiangella rhizosphaerae]